MRVSTNVFKSLERDTQCWGCTRVTPLLLWGRTRLIVNQSLKLLFSSSILNSCTVWSFFSLSHFFLFQITSNTCMRHSSHVVFESLVLRTSTPSTPTGYRLTSRCVYYEETKREVNRIRIYECRCDERLRVKAEGSTRLTYSGLDGGLEHLKMETPSRFTKHVC
jgi:hypothetical protein